MELPKELTENLDPIKASLNFILAMAMLAKELNRSSPDEDIIKNAYELLKKSAEFSIPAEIASNLSLDDWKKLSLNKETLEKTHQAILNEIKEGGFEQFVSKKDINDVFKILKDPNARIKGKIIKCLKIIAAILTSPIAFSISMVIALSALIFIATVPLWMGISYLIYKWREHESQKDLEEYLKQDMSTI